LLGIQIPVQKQFVLDIYGHPVFLGFQGVIIGGAEIKGPEDRNNGKNKDPHNNRQRKKISVECFL
jgi:hypothetical protein